VCRQGSAVQCPRTRARLPSTAVVRRCHAPPPARSSSGSVACRVFCAAAVIVYAFRSHAFAIEQASRDEQVRWHLRAARRAPQKRRCLLRLRHSLRVPLMCEVRSLPASSSSPAFTLLHASRPERWLGESGYRERQCVARAPGCKWFPAAPCEGQC